MDDWTFDGIAYQVVSMYSVPADAWIYELSVPVRATGTEGGLAVVIPDSTPGADGFTPSDASLAEVALADGHLPWPVVQRFITYVEASGDLLPLSDKGSPDPDVAVNSHHDDEHGCWRYQLDELIEVRIPDLRPSVRAPAHLVVFTANGSPTFPWPVFRRFLDAIAAGGHIEGATEPRANEEPRQSPRR